MTEYFIIGFTLRYTLMNAMKEWYVQRAEGGNHFALFSKRHADTTQYRVKLSGNVRPSGGGLYRKALYWLST